MTVLVKLDEAAPVDCTGASLVVASFPLREACPGVPRVDRFSVWHEGATAVWLGTAVRSQSDRAWRGDRPWVPAVPTPHRRAASVLPRAMAE